MQRRTTDKLHVEVALSKRSASSFPHCRERFEHEVIKRLAIVEPLSKDFRQLTELSVRASSHGWFEVIDGPHHGLATAQILALSQAEEFGQHHDPDASLTPAKPTTP